MTVTPGDDGLFDGRIAETYDDSCAFRFEAAALQTEVEFLWSLAGVGPVLELAIGTGRVALPLIEHGAEVHGIELSNAMVAKLRGKPGGGAVPVTIGDMATADAPSGPYSLVYLVFNTITNLLTQGSQVECFRNVARHLAPGGRFCIETEVRDLRRLPSGEKNMVAEATPGHLCIDSYDLVQQASTSHHTWFHDDGSVERFDSHHRYVWPSELDLMARIVGLELEARYGGFDRRPFTDESTRHVSVWRKANDASVRPV